MQSMPQLNIYNLQSIIALNDHLISLEKLDDIFEYLSSYLKKGFWYSENSSLN